MTRLPCWERIWEPQTKINVHLTALTAAIAAMLTIGQGVAAAEPNFAAFEGDQLPGRTKRRASHRGARR
jgi:hypothetical protein